MKPIGPLMIEHRLIERVIELIDRCLDRIEIESAVDPAFIETAVDFFRVYADRTHHGKEEDIFFHDLAGKDLARKDRELMEELIKDHVRARNLVSALETAGRSYRQNRDESRLSEIKQTLQEIANLYPRHIEKEDKTFFPAGMEYLDEKAADEMLGKFADFDRELIHERYREAVERLEGEFQTA